MSHRLIQICTDKNRLTKWWITTKTIRGKVQKIRQTLQTTKWSTDCGATNKYTG